MFAGTLLGSGLLLVAGAPPRATPPGELSTYQWLSGREPLQVELNNTLVEARNLRRPFTRATTICRRLERVSRQLLHSGRAPLPHLGTAANIGIAQFSQAAEACLAGDFPLMWRQIDTGTTLRADAQDTLDQILHGGHSGH
ncbi:hypothetical protein H074_10940 [Amycolatopsis decaplanina DSM 44594]|uniref:Uncharacterized protein n=1 Tax=Amycolatopsis decaplanina DSM 44594 TaxID=1284240 RepID=M2ZLA3_9PSEU|nr:hypothetical protein H074_10940 [Amycolatopsis decaplanina DSM 44594]